jgi:hypothetical protein
MKTKAEKQPNGRPEVEVPVQRRRSDRFPMTVEIDLDAIRATAARMNDPTCDPDAAVETIKRKIAAGEVDRLYTAMIDEYLTISPAETDGDAFGFIEMEFLALRKIMDDEVPDFRPEIHEGILSAVLKFKVMLQMPLSEGAHGKKRRPSTTLGLPTPFVRKRNDAITAIQLAILAAASRARRIGSESYRLWRDALEVVAKKEFGADGAMKAEDVKRLIASLRAANMMLFLDAAIAGYVPLSAQDGEGKEADDVL